MLDVFSDAKSGTKLLPECVFIFIMHMVRCNLIPMCRHTWRRVQSPVSKSVSNNTCFLSDICHGKLEERYRRYI